MEDKNIKVNRLNNWVSLSLKLGMAASLILIIIGLIMLGISGTTDSEQMPSLNQLMQRIIELDPTAIAASGISILLLIPVIQIVVAIIALAMEKDKRYTGIGITLLCLLLFSLFLALN